MSRRQTVAVVIPTYNVERTVQPTLESIKWCDEIIVVDMLSTDRTREICTSFPNCRFFERNDFIYGNVNYGIEQARSDWIIRLDSDEVLSPELSDSIGAVLRDPKPEYDGYEARSHVHFMGYRLRYGFGWENWRTTLFKKGFARYEARSEHEELKRSGRWSRLQGHYDHFTNPTIATWLQKLNYYTDKDLERAVDPRKPSAFQMIYRPARWFQRYYFYPGQAFRDGMPGFVVACIAAFGMFLLQAKLWERAMRLRRGKDFVPPHPNA